MDYDNTNRGAIWKNERKEEDKHPDFTGELDVEGVKFFFDAWKRKPDAGERAPALSFRIKRKDKQPQHQPQTGTTDTYNDPAGDDDIPFD